MLQWCCLNKTTPHSLQMYGFGFMYKHEFDIYTAAAKIPQLEIWPNKS